MAKREDMKVVLRRLIEPDGKTLNLMDIAQDLTDEHDMIQPGLDDWAELTVPRMAETLERMFSLKDISYLLHIHGGKHLIIGAIMAICAIEDSIQGQLDEVDEDDELSDEELEELIADGVGGFGYGSGTKGD